MSATQRRIWKHNSFLGHVAMDKQHMQSIGLADSTTHEAKLIALEILTLLDKLAPALKTRVDPH